MSRTLIIGAGGVAGVVIHKCCQNPEVFPDICIASRTKSKCDAFKAKLDGGRTAITTAQVDADNVDALVALIRAYKPDLVMNIALPYQDLTIMRASRRARITSTPPTTNHRTAKFEYKWQWAYRKKFEAGIGAPRLRLRLWRHRRLLRLRKALLRRIPARHPRHNGGDHGYPFATNFNRRSTSAVGQGQLPRTASGSRPSRWPSSANTTSTGSAAGHVPAPPR